MRIITCTGFYSSGSSAVTDLVAEYADVKEMTDYEFRFLHDLDGVHDLEYHLVHAHNRHNSGHALKRFEKLSKFNSGTFFNSRYEPFFDNQYMKITKEYIEDLLDFQYNGWWFYDLYDKGNLYYYIIQSINKFLQKTKFTKKDILSREITYCSHPSDEKFLKLTRQYVSKLMHAANKENCSYLEIDQIVPSQNINQILRYFEDEIFVFIVDRDPRDVYLNTKLSRSRVCPDDVESFCNWYNYTRESGAKEMYDKQHVKQIHFEDLIFNYQKSVNEIETFLGFSSKKHVKQFEKLNPKRSVNNTQTWIKHAQGLENDIKIIEERCAQYLYPFDLVENNDIPGLDVSDNSMF